MRVANQPRFAAVPLARIVPMMADDGVYLASESTFSRVLRDGGRLWTVAEPGNPGPCDRRPPTPATVIGVWFHLYLTWTCTAAR